MSCAEFIGCMFLARDVAHSVHLNTRSFAKHKALGGFYDNVIDLADKFAEAYQGRHGLIGPISLHSARKTSNITEFLEDSLKEIEDMRYKVCDKSDSALQNIIDEIVELYLTTLYKLKFLA
jgi:DNA-binding ferritin-like protein|tara:strand:- start:1598 stop:1960 length:363 start_codon:yes stop_codon:yes gene_type:complete